MRDKYTDSIRIGTVSSIDPVKCTAKVTFLDRGDNVSRDLHIMQPFTMNDKAYYMPAVGERVRVLFDPEAPTKGCILGSYYSDNRLPPFGDKNKKYVLFEDNTLVEYDKALHKLTIKIPSGGEKSIDIVAESDVFVKTNGNIDVVTAKNINVQSAQTINITATANINLTTKSSCNIDASGIVNIKASEINLNLMRFFLFQRGVHYAKNSTKNRRTHRHLQSWSALLPTQRCWHYHTRQP